jgi:hypothetical protein
VGAAGLTTVTGSTDSSSFPTTNGALQETLGGGFDGFAVLLDPSRSGAQQLLYSTYLGGSDDDYSNAVDIDEAAGAVFAGQTFSANYRTSNNAWRRTYVGSGDGFVTYLDMLPSGAGVSGPSSPGCSGALAMGVTSNPYVGNAGFALTCTNAPPNGNGALLFSTASLSSPLSFLGVQILVDPGTPGFVTFPVGSTARGTAEFPIPIPGLPQLANVSLFTQFLWVGPSAPPPCPPLGLSSSNRLQILIQP